MMGQQEQQTMAVAEEKEGGELRRKILTLTVAAFMALSTALAAADQALAKDFSKLNETPSGNLQGHAHDNDHDSGAVIGEKGTLVIRNNEGNGDLQFGVATPSGNENGHGQVNANNKNTP